MANTKTVTVVIPTYGRPQLLARGLEALAAQTFANERMQVLVVDDGSPEPAPVDEAVAPFLDRMQLTLLRKPNGGLASARNHGAAQATGDVLLFMDDDIIPCPEFVEAHLAIHEQNERAAAIGSLPHPDDLVETPFLWYLNQITHYDLFKRYGSAESIPLPPLNGNSSVHRRDFEAAGGYDLAFGSYGGEDTDMGYRLLADGVEFVYARAARGYHYHVKGFDAYQRDMYSTGVTMVTLVNKHPQVLERVNMDLVERPFLELDWKKRAQKLLLLVLEAAPFLVSGMNALVRLLTPLGLKRILYPLHLVVGHFHYARGMREQIARAGLDASARTASR